MIPKDFRDTVREHDLRTAMGDDVADNERDEESSLFEEIISALVLFLMLALAGVVAVFNYAPHVIDAALALLRSA